MADRELWAAWKEDTTPVGTVAVHGKPSLTFGNSQPLLLLGKAAERGFQCLGHHFFAAGR